MAKRKNTDLVCKFCDKEFKTESGLVKHACRNKLRWLDKDTKVSRIAFLTYTRFYGMSTTTKEPTFEHFIKSSYYDGFTRFARHIIQIGMKYPEDFIMYVLRSSIRLDDWCKNTVYEEYILTRQNREEWETGLERTIMTMTEWAEENNRPWTEFCSAVTPNEITHMIKLGRISPWWIYSSDRAKSIIAQMNEEQLLLVHKFIDSTVWKRRLLTDQTDTARLKTFIVEHNL